MANEDNKNDQIVDVDGLDFTDDIEQIVISDYSEDEGNGILQAEDNSTPNVTSSEIKISSVVSCSGLNFGDHVEDQVHLESDGEKKAEDTASENKIESVLSEGQDNEDSSSDFNFSYDSLTEEEKLDDEPTSKHAEDEKKRRDTLLTLYHSLWKAISSESKKPSCSKIELLETSSNMIKKLTLESRTLEYSAELCMQSNHRLHRRFVKVIKKTQKKCKANKEKKKPEKVSTSRASI